MLSRFFCSSSTVGISLARGEATRSDAQGRVELPADYRTQREPTCDQTLELTLAPASAELLAARDDRALAAASVLAALLHRHTQQTEIPIELPGRCLAFTLQPTSRLADVSCGAARGSNVAFAIDGPLGSHYELALTLQSGTLTLGYDSQRFAVERARELLAQYAQLLAAVLAEPEAVLASHSLVTEQARALLPSVDSAISRPMHPLLHEAFVSWAERTPDAIALREENRDSTYRELADYAAELARRIRARVQPGDVVAITGPRCFALLAGMLGIFQSGAILLTLDPKLPKERRRAMVAQAKARLLLIAGEEATCETRIEGIEVLSLSARWDGRRTEGTLPAVSSAAPAYVFFTSGSTGTPKAVLGSHRGLSHFLAWQRSTFGVGPGDIASQLTALSFDVVLRDMFLALTSGATLALPRESDVIEPARILAWLEREQITVLHVVPSLMRLWLNHVPERANLRSLRHVFFAGEPLTDALVARFRGVFGEQVQVKNLYGPTETTLAKCCFVVPSPALPGVQPIGRPLPETQVLMLNAHNALCGLYEVGQIALRTPFRSFGYLNDPEANARVFVQNPYSDDADDLVYLSGDSGRYRADGSLEILGRIDNQVKIRGVRIEPGEIEATLARHPVVRESAVVAREDDERGKFLAAYVVLKNGQQDHAQIAELRAYLRARLSEVMVPSAFVLMPALPLNANGKVDRKALPTPERSGAQSRKKAPRTERERELAAVWQEALAFGDIGVDESFYDLGGDSLTAIRVMLRMRALGLDEQVCRGILQGRTIEELAAQLDGSVAELSESPHERMRTLLNVLRGVLLTMIVLNHFWPGIVRRMPVLAQRASWFEVLWNWGTPGFVLAFGITLGFVYLPLYAADRGRAQLMLRQGAMLVGVAAGVFTTVRAVMAQLMADQHDVNPLLHVTMFYFLALLGADLWMRGIARARRPVLTTLLFASGCALLELTLQRMLGVAALPGPGVLLLGKYGYFGMSVGMLLGIAVGQRLRADMDVDPVFAKLGVLSMLVGFALSSFEPAEHAWLQESDSQSPWRWFFYGGATLLLIAGLARALHWMPRRGLRGAVVRVVAVVGQLSLPLFLLHLLSKDLGNVATLIGAPASVRFGLEFGAFGLSTLYAVRRTYSLFHGSTRTHKPPPRNSNPPMLPLRDSIAP